MAIGSWTEGRVVVVGPGRAGAVRCGQAGSGGRAHGGRGQLRVRLRRPLLRDFRPSHSSTLLSQQTSHQQPASSTLLLKQISTSHQPPANRTGRLGRRRSHVPRLDGTRDSNIVSLAWNQHGQPTAPDTRLRASASSAPYLAPTIGMNERSSPFSTHGYCSTALCLLDNFILICYWSSFIKFNDIKFADLTEFHEMWSFMRCEETLGISVWLVTGVGYSEIKILLANCWWLICSERTDSDKTKLSNF
jgi:hypothetical protein